MRWCPTCGQAVLEKLRFCETCTLPVYECTCPPINECVCGGDVIKTARMWRCVPCGLPIERCTCG